MRVREPSLLTRLLERFFPKMPDFFGLLSDQAALVSESLHIFLRFMETGDEALGEQVRRNEHAADKLKARNLHALNEAFSTPIDRENLYRAITDLDHIVNYCKTTVQEMHLLQVKPDTYTVQMAQRMCEGTDALVEGFRLLGSNPEAAVACADAGRKAERRVEKLYRAALVELFQGEDYLNMFRRREIYRHLSNAADRLARASNTLHDIVVKMV